MSTSHPDPQLKSQNSISPATSRLLLPGSRIYESAVDTPLYMEIIPTTVCMLANTILILINVYNNKRSEHQLIGMGLGTVFSNMIGYLLISSLNIGLACEIARAKEKKRDRIVGIYYQRALVVDFMACILIITPILYLSKTILLIYNLSDNKVVDTISKYLFQLVPSIYAFTFFDTTRVYLQAQYIRSPPMLILLVSIFFHYFISSELISSSEMESMGAAWAKNFTDLACAIVIYIYVVKSGVVKSTWIQWNMQCLTNWSRHLKLFVIIGFTSYLEALMFLIFIVEGSSLSTYALAAHISLANWTQIYFLVFLGLKQGLLTQLYQLIAKNMWYQARQRAIYGIKLTIALSLGLDLLLILYKKEACNFFLSKNHEAAVDYFDSCFWIYLLSNLIDAIQLVICAILKAIDNTHPVLKTSFACYAIGLILAPYLAHVRKMELRGFWIGWTIGLFLNLIFCILYLYRLLKRWSISNLSQKLLSSPINS